MIYYDSTLHHNGFTGKPEFLCGPQGGLVFNPGM